MAASSSSGSSANYEVFLSFSGGDTRNNFTSFLHRDLKERGINVFIDSENVRTGESIDPTLRAAIQKSKISIPVISGRYVESKWCLIELVEIVKCHRSIGQVVLPIFFNVVPSDVRNQKKSFEEAFQKHEKKFDPQVIESWKDALKAVADLSGNVVDDNRNQAELVNLVVERVLRELSNTRLAECKFPIRIDSSVNDLKCLLDLDSKDVHFVGVYGIGGIGKTTIVKTLYNRISLTFNKHCFIPEVGEQATQMGGLVSLQQRLLKDILKLNNIENFDIDRIKQRLCDQKVFLVLDDVDSVEQLNALVGEIKLGQGSRVIITTRDKRILDAAEVKKTYEPSVLNPQQSLELLSLHAFSSESPPEDFMQISEGVVRYSGGLPLTLRVLGCLLSKRSIEVWESTLECLKEIPPKEVQTRLKISYDKLEKDYQKEIFLDAACLFIGWPEEVVTSIWEACGYQPTSAIPILIERSLIKFEVDHRSQCVLKMHNQIRDMGKGIVLGEKDPCKRSRLWPDDDILQLFERKMGTEMTKSMVLLGTLPDISLHQQHFEMMSNLRFLHINFKSIDGNFWHPLFNLRCLWWTSCPWTIVPTSFYHKSLVHLKLSGLKIEEAWNTGPPNRNKFPKLKVLDLNGCHNLSKSPNFSWFPCLEQLDLSYCRELEILDQSIGQLSRLKTLNLERCQQIMELPNSIGNLKSLVDLNLSSTSIKELPYNFSKLSSLKNLKLIGCSSLKKLPAFSQQKLVELHFSKHDDKNDYAKGIEEFPDSFGSKGAPLHAIDDEASVFSLDQITDARIDLELILNTRIDQEKMSCPWPWRD